MINWALFVIVTLLFIFFVLFVRFKHFTSRSIKQELIVKRDDSNTYQGTYFTRYIPAKKHSLQVVDNESVSKKISRKINRKIGWDVDVKTFKLGLSALLVVIFMAGIVASLSVNSTQQPLSNRSNNNNILVTTDDSIIEHNVNNANDSIAKRHWKDKALHPVPVLETELSKLKSYGLVLVNNKTSSTEAFLNNLKQQSQQEWTDFAGTYKIKTATCTWERLVTCQQRYQGWVFVILPDFWQLAGLDKLLESGASVLLYDAPFQVASAYTTGEFALYGLAFEQLLVNKVKPQHQKEQLILIGERELHFGFDSGTILNIARRSAFYKATSTRPQALALPIKNRAGDVLMTRLYAASIGKGRLVWMDFIPHQEQLHVDGVMASLFGYLGRTEVLPRTMNVGKK